MQNIYVLVVFPCGYVKILQPVAICTVITTGRTQHLETRDDTEWPALPSHRRVSSTPVPRKKQPWNVAKTKSKSKPTKDTGILQENRFAPLLQDPDSPKER